MSSVQTFCLILLNFLTFCMKFIWPTIEIICTRTRTFWAYSQPAKERCWVKCYSDQERIKHNRKGIDSNVILTRKGLNTTDEFDDKTFLSIFHAIFFHASLTYRYVFHKLIYCCKGLLQQLLFWFAFLSTFTSNIRETAGMPCGNIFKAYSPNPVTIYSLQTAHCNWYMNSLSINGKLSMAIIKRK